MSVEAKGGKEMDANLMTDYEQRRREQEEQRERERAQNAGIFRSLAPASLLYALIYTVCVYHNLSGIAVLFWAAATVGYVCYAARTAGKRPGRESLFFASAMLLLGVSTFTTGNLWIVWMNYLLFFLLTVCFLLREFGGGQWGFGAYVKEFFAAVWGALTDVGKPFADGNDFIRTRKKGENTKAHYVLFGIAAALPALLFLGLLLMAADMVFADMVREIFQNFSLPSNVFGIGFMLCFGFFSSYCGVRFVGRRQGSADSAPGRSFEPVIAITAVSMVAVLYVIFCGVQVLYLFWGGLRLPEGITYAEYARSGFFQLLFVCLINLVMVLLIEHFFRRQTALDIILTVISVCTLIMTASSAWRMALYVRAYHLTFLRVAVFAALAVIALLMAGTVVFIWKPKFPLFRYGVAVICVLYGVFSFSHVDGYIASYNLAQMEEHPDSGDYYYISCLSTDAAPQIAAYLSEHPGAETVSAEYGTYDWLAAYIYQNEHALRSTGWRSYNTSHAAAYELFSGKIETVLRQEP